MELNTTYEHDLSFINNAVKKQPNINDKLNHELSEKKYFVGNYFSDIEFINFHTEWNYFVDTWNDLPQDQFMADGGKYRQRRYSRIFYDAADKKLNFPQHEAFFQSDDLNTLNGGIDRHFECITPYVANHPVVQNMVDNYVCIFKELGYRDKWMINLHQVRIVATEDYIGDPAPEGMHKDGVTFTTLLCVDRHNVKGGVNYVYDNDKNLLEELTLLHCGQLIIMSDEDLYHDVSQVSAADNTGGKRDMLFVEFTEVC